MTVPGSGSVPRNLTRGLGGAVLLAAVSACWESAPARVAAPRQEHATAHGLVVISLDTVRRDHLPTYGYSRPTAPAVDRLAQGAVVFENAFTPDTNTNPAHTSVFTGVYPHMHGNRANGVRLREGEITLAEALARNGFRTAGFVTGITLAARASGLERGFEVYDDAFEGKRRPGRIAVERALEWLDALGHDERFFLFVHLFDAHGPYRPDPPYDALFHTPGPPRPLSSVPRYQLVTDENGEPQNDLNGYIDRYDAGIRVADDCVSALLERLDLERTAVIVMADHGETLGERAWPLDHGSSVFDEQTRVPLIVHTPGMVPQRVAETVELIDVLPTALELLGVPRPARRPVLGESLVPLLSGAESSREPREVTFASARAETVRHVDRGYELDRARRIVSVRGWRWKLVLYPGIERDYVELYDLDSDPDETANIAEQHPAQRDALLGLLEGWAALGAARDPAAELDADLEASFRALGYVGDDER